MSKFHVLCGLLLTLSTGLACKKTDGESNLKIRGGVVADSNSQGAESRSVAMIVTPEGRLCTASIVAEDLLLTATHCRKAIEGGEVRFGVDATKPDAVLKISDFRFNAGPAETGGDNSNDVALVKLASKIPAAFRPSPIYIGALVENEVVIQAGYGAQGAIDGSDIDGKLRWVVTNYIQMVKENVIYTFSDEDKGICVGDSGGPLFVIRDNDLVISAALSATQQSQDGKRCALGALYASTKLNYSTLVKWGKELTGREAPFHKVVGGANRDEPKPEEPKKEEPKKDEPKKDDEPLNRPWGERHSLISASSGKCVVVKNTNSNPDTLIVQNTCSDTSLSGQFKINYLDAEKFQLISKLNGKCLDVWNWSQSNGGNLITWDCKADQGNQHFTKTDNKNGSWLIKNVHSGKCLSIEGDHREDGASLVIWECGDGLNQQFWVGNPR